MWGKTHDELTVRRPSDCSDAFRVPFEDLHLACITDIHDFADEFTGRAHAQRIALSIDGWLVFTLKRLRRVVRLERTLRF